MELSSSYKLLCQATIILSAFSPPSFTAVSAHIDQAPRSVAVRQKGGDLRYKNKICLTAGVKTAATAPSHLLTESPHLGLGVQQGNLCCQGRQCGVFGLTNEASHFFHATSWSKIFWQGFLVRDCLILQLLAFLHL